MASELEKVVAEMRAEIANGDGERVQAYMVEQWADRLAALDGGWRPIEEAPRDRAVSVWNPEWTGGPEMCRYNERWREWEQTADGAFIEPAPTLFYDLPTPPEGAKP